MPSPKLAIRLGSDPERITIGSLPYDEYKSGYLYPIEDIDQYLSVAHRVRFHQQGDAHKLGSISMGRKSQSSNEGRRH